MGSASWPRVKTYYVNVAGSESRRACSEHQLSRLQQDARNLGWKLDYERFPAVTFQNCTKTSECIEERPECFPMRKAGYVHHGLIENAENSAQMVRGVLGNWCSHLRLLEHMARAKHRYHFFLLLEDDVIITDGFALALDRFFKEMAHFWNLVALDTFGGGGRVPEQDAFGSEHAGALRLNSLSSTMNSYWGAHAWLVNAEHLQRFITFYRQTPAIPLDWVTKAAHPLHLGIWAYDTGALRQRQHAGDADLSRHPAFCKDMAGSDLLGGGMSIPEMQSTSVLKPANLTIDQNSQALPFVREQRVDATSVATPQGKLRKVVVLGMFGSGAQFVQEMIRNNLGKPGSDGLHVSDKVWRHQHPRRFSAGDPELAGAVAVAVIRHPFSQLRSIQRHQEQWELSCTTPNISGSAGIDSSCGFSNATSQDVTLACREGGDISRCWASLPEAWNSYTASYKALRSQGIFKKVLRLRYEDVVENPRLALMWVGLAVGMHPASIDEEISEAILWGNTGDKEYTNSLRKLGRKAYGSNFSCTELKALCSRVNRGLMYSHGYHGCQGAWPGFTQLIYNGTLFEDHPEKVASVFDQSERLNCDAEEDV